MPSSVNLLLFTTCFFPSRGVHHAEFLCNRSLLKPGTGSSAPSLAAK